MASESAARARRIAAQVGRMSDDQRAELAKKMPGVANPQGHTLSITNSIGLMMQCGRTDLTIVAGFRQWMKAGRSVTKGERSIGCILVPCAAKGETPESSDQIWFRAVPVFDVSQTDAIVGAA